MSRPSWMPSGLAPRLPNAAVQVATCANTRTTFGGLIAVQNLVEPRSPPSHHQHELWRVRSRERRGSQCRLQLRISAGGGGRAFRCSWPPATKARPPAMLGPRARRTESASAALPRPPTTSRWAAPISAILTPAQPAPTGVPPTRRPMDRPNLTFRRFRGTIPARASLLSDYFGYTAPYGAAASAAVPPLRQTGC